jgi:L-ectoine synthase
MIIRSIDQLVGGERDVKGGGWRSRRLLRKDDGCNFSLHWTELSAGTELELEYEHHIEANLIVTGEGEVVDVATGEPHRLGPGVMYTLDKHDRHRLRAISDLQLVCVFWPALSGAERHNAKGGYDPLE